MSAGSLESATAAGAGDEPKERFDLGFWFGSPAVICAQAVDRGLRSHEIMGRWLK